MTHNKSIQTCQVIHIQSVQICCDKSVLILTHGSDEMGVLGVGAGVSIPVAILPSCQDMKTIAL